MAGALDDLAPENMESFHLFTSDLNMAILNHAPFSEEPVIGLDPSWVRLCLDAHEIPRNRWPETIQKFLILHRCREASRKKAT